MVSFRSSVYFPTHEPTVRRIYAKHVHRVHLALLLAYDTVFFIFMLQISRFLTINDTISHSPSPDSDVETLESFKSTIRTTNINSKASTSFLSHHSIFLCRHRHHLQQIKQSHKSFCFDIQIVCKVLNIERTIRSKAEK